MHSSETKGPRPLLAEPGAETVGDPVPTLAEARARAELQVILAALEQSSGRRKATALLLGLSEATLYRKLARLKLPPVLPNGTRGLVEAED